MPFKLLQIPPAFRFSEAGFLFCYDCSVENKQMGLKKIQKYKWGRNCLKLLNSIKIRWFFFPVWQTNLEHKPRYGFTFNHHQMFYFVFFLLKSKANLEVFFFFNSDEWKINDWYLKSILNWGSGWGRNSCKILGYMDSFISAVKNFRGTNLIN